ncbi:hypothetical protein [Hahella sp. CCB-MM4]|uniref:hypothetical protein n=1 Tax=Hahella sp. (strain CCB-MM4) TaxID=1926491 RepID=UPI000B9AFA5F|nr:hypothetical protein [Hahella sp. CCB-MM4]
MTDKLSSTLRSKLRDVMHQQALPESFESTLEKGILPTAAYIAHHHDSEKAPIWGICGAQGTGKSTLVHFLQVILEEQFHLKCISLSLDDVYLSRAARIKLSEDIHPLFATRGVPGTHDVELGMQTLISLQNASEGQKVQMPRFNKATDDCVDKAQWPTVTGPFDVILFEGWCVGSQPQPSDLLTPPINQLEADEDREGTWRDYVNQQLRTRYAQWFGLLDHLILLKVPGFEQVKEWRSLQEHKLRQSYLDRGDPIPDRVMTPGQVERFIQHYERLTRWNLETLPSVSDVVLELQEDHKVSQVRFR